MKQLRWPVDDDGHAYMRMRQQQNLGICKTNPNENWFADQLTKASVKFSRQAQWGHRLFDFWIARQGVAIEIDGPEHDPQYDAYRDEYNFRRSAIVVLRVKNQNQEDADTALALLNVAGTWQARRDLLRITRKKNQLVAQEFTESMLAAYIAGLLDGATKKPPTGAVIQ